MEASIIQKSGPFGGVLLLAFASFACGGGGQQTAETAGPAAGASSSTPVASNSNTQAASTPAQPAAATPTSAASPAKQVPTATSMTAASTPAATPDAGTVAVEASSKGDLPCNVKQSVTRACASCHGATPIGGAPMSLLTAEDFHKPAVTQPSLEVYELALMRMKDAAKPMPPAAAPATAPDKAALEDWLRAGAVPEVATDKAACHVEAPTDVTPTSQRAGAEGLTARPGETCYDFQSHNGMTADDKTPYEVVEGEHYEQFYFKVPWPDNAVATRFGTKIDNRQVLHHWLMFSSSRSATLDGTHEGSSGSQLGDSGAQMMAGWALGGDDIELPPDMGLQLPAAGVLNASWHFFNRTGGTAMDHSAAQVCVVDKSMRKNIASWSSLGTEDLGGAVGMPAKQRSQYGGTCQNHSTGPVTIWAFMPHMHQLGRQMTAVVNRVDGTQETVFDKPFDFNSQIHYPQSPMLVLQSGDRITSTCSFENSTNAAVPYGPSSDQEMCYMFTFAYPAGALDNHAFSLTGISNSCWGD